MEYINYNNLSTWQKNYLNLSDYIAREWSRDPSTKCGAVIVDEDGVQVSSGVNGFAQSFHDSPQRWNDREFKYRHVIHAEENALLFARQSVKGCTIYVTGPPCSSCMSKIKQKKIKRVICWEPTEDYLSRWSVDEPLQVASEGKHKVEVIFIRRPTPVCEDVLQPAVVKKPVEVNDKVVKCSGNMFCNGSRIARVRKVTDGWAYFYHGKNLNFPPKFPVEDLWVVEYSKQ